MEEKYITQPVPRTDDHVSGIGDMKGKPSLGALVGHIAVVVARNEKERLPEKMTLTLRPAG